MKKICNTNGFVCNIEGDNLNILSNKSAGINIKQSLNGSGGLYFK
jgi:hypothetical protein